MGRDVLARARTGSGKTGAYALPMLNMILSAEVRALFLLLATSCFLPMALAYPIQLQKTVIRRLPSFPRCSYRRRHTVTLTRIPPPPPGPNPAQDETGVLGVVLVPTKELAHQAARNLKVRAVVQWSEGQAGGTQPLTQPPPFPALQQELSNFCSDNLRIATLTSDGAVKAQQYASKPPRLTCLDQR